MKETFDIQQGDAVGQVFQPFYERIPDQFPIPFAVKLLISILLGFLFLGPHYWAAGEGILEDWSWLLGLVIVVAMMSLYYATHTFRAMFPYLNVRLKSQDTTCINDAYFNKINHYLSDRMFLHTGLLFATLNCGVGWILDTSYPSLWATTTIYLGYVISGFVCGLAVCGIRGVVVTLSSYFEHEPKVDYTNPDECGGNEQQPAGTGRPGGSRENQQHQVHRPFGRGQQPGHIAMGGPRIGQDEPQNQVGEDRRKVQIIGSAAGDDDRASQGHEQPGVVVLGTNRFSRPQE